MHKKKGHDKKHEHHHLFDLGYGSGEITLTKLVIYNLLFIIPILISMFFSSIISEKISVVLEVNKAISMQIIMLFFTFILFLFMIPFIRRRESVKGVRYSLIGFLILAIGVTIPTLVIERSFNLLLIEFPHIATYILLTFIYTPEVLGIDMDISKWFKHFKQLMIIIIYTSIVLLYVSGFGWIFYNIAVTDPGAFSYSIAKPVEYPQFLYFSIISFATIGYGDITPVASGARFLVCIEAIISSIVNVIFIAILFVYISNFRAFIKGIKKEEAMIEKEEKAINKLERKINKKKKRND